MWYVIYGKGTQLQAASTQNVPRVDDLNFTTSHLRIAIFYLFFSITFFPYEEFFKNSFNSKKMIISSKSCRKKDGPPCSFRKKWPFIYLASLVSWRNRHVVNVRALRAFPFISNVCSVTYPYIFPINTTRRALLTRKFSGNFIHKNFLYCSFRRFWHSHSSST